MLILYTKNVAKTRKIQVTLEDSQYEALAQIAARDGKKLAAVVRESVVQYCLGPEAKKAKRQALKALLEESAPPPEEYAAWKRRYLDLKAGSDTKFSTRKPRHGS